MNDIAKNRISERLTEAIQKEGISKSAASRIMGITDPYVGMVVRNQPGKEPPEWCWEVIKRWTNSGENFDKFPWHETVKTVRQEHGITGKKGLAKPMTAKELTKKIKDEHPVEKLPLTEKGMQRAKEIATATIDAALKARKAAEDDLSDSFRLLEIDEEKPEYGLPKWLSDGSGPEQPKPDFLFNMEKIKKQLEEYNKRLSEIENYIRKINIANTDEPLISRAQMSATERTITIKVKV